MAKNPKTPTRPRDLSQLAKHIVDITTGEESDESVEPTAIERRGSKGGKARAEKLTSAERSAIARKAALARWEKD